MVVAVAASGQACGHSGDRASRDGSGDVAVRVISRERRDRYRITGDSSTLRVSAPSSNTGSNLRVVAVAADAPTSVDQEACTTWTGRGGIIAQPGIALRVHGSATKTQALTVADNIYYGARHIFNFYVADTTQGPKQHMAQIGSFIPSGFAPDVASVPDPPWRLCARVVGRRFEAKVWSIRAGQPEPAYGDPAFSGSVDLAPGLVYAGRPGTYIGHLAPGQSTALVDGSIRRLR